MILTTNPLHVLTAPAEHSATLSETLCSLIVALEAAARIEGRAIAGSTAADLPPLRDTLAHTDAARTALIHALAAQAHGGAR